MSDNDLLWRQQRSGWGGRSMLLNRMDEQHLGKDLREIRDGAMWIPRERALQAGAIVGAKALRQKYV